MSLEPATLQADPQTAQMIRKLRRLMLIAGLTVALGIGAVMSVIGYRLFRGDGSAALDVTERLPKGARIVSTATAGDRVLVTIDNGGTLEIRSFDAKSLKPAGRLRFATEP